MTNDAFLLASAFFALITGSISLLTSDKRRGAWGWFLMWLCTAVFMVLLAVAEHIRGG